MLQQHSKISSERGAGREGVVWCGKQDFPQDFPQWERHRRRSRLHATLAFIQFT